MLSLKALIPAIGAAVLVAGGIGYALAKGGAPVAAEAPKPGNRSTGPLTEKGLHYFAENLGRPLTPVEIREISLFVETGRRNGYDMDRMRDAVEMGLQASKKKSVADGFAFAARLQGSMGVIGRDRTDLENRQAEAWRTCALQLKQIEDGLL